MSSPSRQGEGAATESERSRSDGIARAAAWLNRLMESLTHFRAQKDEFMRQHPQSPLPFEARATFGGLSYFDPAPELRFELPFEPADGTEVRVQTSDGQVRTYTRAGVVSFDVDGEPTTLTLYSGHGGGYFVPFRDATSGKETYGAGRYLDLEPNGDGTVSLDFNYAYSPYCAYDEAYSCPLPPHENWLRVQIRAGERHPPLVAKSAGGVTEDSEHHHH